MVSKLLTNFKRRQILNYIADSFAEEFDTLTANDGREGLATALDKTPDIIISDIMMPNMDGNKYKMQYAEHLLLEGKYTISEISFMVGMNSIAYFRKCFKDEYGLIPSEYLKKLKSENEGNE